jgi:hypothetical protein
LVLASAIACSIIVACRAATHLLSLHHAELDGITFLAGVYWALSAIGYVAARRGKKSPSPNNVRSRAGARTRRSANEAGATSRRYNLAR